MVDEKVIQPCGEQIGSDVNADQFYNKWDDNYETDVKSWGYDMPQRVANAVKDQYRLEQICSALLPPTAAIPSADRRQVHVDCPTQKWTGGTRAVALDAADPPEDAKRHKGDSGLVQQMVFYYSGGNIEQAFNF
eukprot:gene1058-738_t